MSGPLTAGQLAGLKVHKYSVTGSSLLEPFMTKYVWLPCVSMLPMWWAPNAITLMGLFFNVGTILILAWYSPDCKQQPPKWAHIAAGIGLFVYQLMDALDGKQARRTNSSSPLGELFDHGCDAIATAFLALGVCITLSCGHSPGFVFFVTFTAMVSYYITHWQAYISGTLDLGGFFHVTEMQLTIVFAFFLSGTIGMWPWNYDLGYLGLRTFLFPVMFAFGLFGLAQVLAGASNPITNGQYATSCAGTSIYSPFPALAITFSLAVILWKTSTTRLFETHPALFVVTFAGVFGKLTTKLVVAHMAKSEIEWLDTAMLGPVLLLVNQLLKNPVNQYLALWICCIYTNLNLLVYNAGVCRQLCEHLSIYCFSIAKRTPDGDTAKAHAQ